MTIAPPIAIADTTAPVRKKPTAARMPAPSSRNQIKKRVSPHLRLRPDNPQPTVRTRHPECGIGNQERTATIGADAREHVGDECAETRQARQNRSSEGVKTRKTAATVVTPIPRIR